MVERKVGIYRPLMTPACRPFIAAKSFNILSIFVSHEVRVKKLRTVIDHVVITVTGSFIVQWTTF
jgi:hypothetical protein